VLRDLRARYAGSAFGFVWAFLNPLWHLVLYTLIFSTVLRISLVGERTGSFATFLFAGLLPWMAFSEGISRGAAAIRDNAELVKKLRFPSYVLVLAAVISALVHSGIALVLFAMIQSARGEVELRHLPWMLLGIAGQLALTTGLALFAAPLQVYLRDVQHTLTLVLSALFYLTPIVYPIGLVPEHLRPWLYANPLTALVTLYRTFLIGSDPPSAVSVLGLAAAAAALLGIGATVFRRLEGGFSDQL